MRSSWSRKANERTRRRDGRRGGGGEHTMGHANLLPDEDSLYTPVHTCTSSEVNLLVVQSYTLSWESEPIGGIAFDCRV